MRMRTIGSELRKQQEELGAGQEGLELVVRGDW